MRARSRRGSGGGGARGCAGGAAVTCSYTSRPWHALAPPRPVSRVALRRRALPAPRGGGGDANTAPEL